MRWWGILLLISAKASGAEPLFCASPEALLGAAGGCAGNGVFVEAARACLAKLNAEEEARGSVIQEAARLAKQGQSADTLAARQGYQKSMEAMAQLHGLAVRGRDELLLYERFLALPTLETAPLLARDGSLNVAGALGAGCFASAMQGLRSVQGEFSGKIERYGARHEEARAAAGTLGKSLGNLKTSSSLTAPVKAGKATGPVSKKPARNGPSTITGKIRNEKLPR